MDTITPYNNRLLQWLRLGIVKNSREKTNRRKKLNISADSTPLKASDGTLAVIITDDTTTHNLTNDTTERQSNNC
ncbi:hypothetical protein NAT47_07025 [Flavobacterium sp. HXWNR69]|uniref:Uncharacterized protein n=1 Tax=Flavobacterium fragile TaxID=2949085 RepID=A0ABT0TGQ7_9FLAO|nr:hypothetical protein [Flavobacterium sp. HXWNR69]MCL9770164.1 hypothetical protein [Flavobacterium sp. HXWNR69]